MTWKTFKQDLQNEGKSHKRIKKLHTMYNVVARHMNIDTATKDTLKDYVAKLHNNEIKNKSGQDYTGTSKSDIKKFIKQ